MEVRPRCSHHRLVKLDSLSTLRPEGRRARRVSSEACACVENARTTRVDTGEFEQVRLMPNVRSEVFRVGEPTAVCVEPWVIVVQARIENLAHSPCQVCRRGRSRFKHDQSRSPRTRPRHMISQAVGVRFGDSRQPTVYVRDSGRSVLAQPLRFSRAHRARATLLAERNEVREVIGTVDDVDPVLQGSVEARRGPWAITHEPIAR